MWVTPAPISFWLPREWFKLSMLLRCGTAHRRSTNLRTTKGRIRETSVRAGFKVLREQNLITSDYRWANNADEALRFILTRGPVVIGSKCYPGMGQPTNGVMRLSGSAGSMGHAYLLFGFSPDQDAFLVANSWGLTFGIDGCAFLPYDALDQLIDEGGVVCSAIEE